MQYLKLENLEPKLQRVSWEYERLPKISEAIYVNKMYVCVHVCLCVCNSIICTWIQLTPHGISGFLRHKYIVLVVKSQL